MKTLRSRVTNNHVSDTILLPIAKSSDEPLNCYSQPIEIEEFEGYVKGAIEKGELESQFKVKCRRVFKQKFVKKNPDFFSSFLIYTTFEVTFLDTIYRLTKSFQMLPVGMVKPFQCGSSPRNKSKNRDQSLIACA